MAESLSDMILNSRSDDIDTTKAPLSAANPMVSGFGRSEEITDINYTVTVECDKENLDKAKDIMNKMGGLLDEPNVSRYEAISDADVIVEKAVDSMSNDVDA